MPLRSYSSAASSADSTASGARPASARTSASPMSASARNSRNSVPEAIATASRATRSASSPRSQRASALAARFTSLDLALQIRRRGGAVERLGQRQGVVVAPLRVKRSSEVNRDGRQQPPVAEIRERVAGRAEAALACGRAPGEQLDTSTQQLVHRGLPPKAEVARQHQAVRDASAGVVEAPGHRLAERDPRR